MDWSEYDFILILPSSAAEDRPQPTYELTGWETVVFELEDDDGGSD